MFTVLRLGQAEIGVKNLDEARAFYVDLLGFTEYERDKSSLYLRASEEFDVWSLKLTSASTPGLYHFGFRVASNGDLDALETKHRELGLRTKRLPEGSEPGLGQVLRAETPDGHSVKFYHDIEEISVEEPNGGIRLPMRQTHRQNGIPPVRIDHMNLRVKDPSRSLNYWRDTLGFSMSEYHMDPNGDIFTVWLRRRTGTHDVALGRYERAAVHHVAYYVSDAATVLRTADLLADARMQHHIDFGPGRHGVSNAFFIYIRDPFGNRIEIYTSDYSRDLDRPPIAWKWEDYHSQGLLWWGQKPPERFRETNPLIRLEGWLS